MKKKMQFKRKVGMEKQDLFQDANIFLLLKDNFRGNSGGEYLKILFKVENIHLKNGESL